MADSCECISYRFVNLLLCFRNVCSARSHGRIYFKSSARWTGGRVAHLDCDSFRETVEKLKFCMNAAPSSATVRPSYQTGIFLWPCYFRHYLVHYFGVIAHDVSAKVEYNTIPHDCYSAKHHMRRATTGAYYPMMPCISGIARSHVALGKRLRYR